MSTSRSQPDEPRLPRCRGTVPEPELQDKLYDSICEMYNLLEQYSPRWYPDILREKVEALLQTLKMK